MMDVGLYDDIVNDPEDEGVGDFHPEARNAWGEEAEIEPEEGEYTVYSAADALLPQKRIKWIVEELLSEDSVNLVVGQPDSKKTWLLIDMALSIAAGVPWLGRETKQATVLFIDEEAGERWMKDRIKKVLAGRHLDGEIPCWFISNGMFNLRTESGVDRLRMAIQDCGARVVCIDALVDILGGADENRSSDGVQPIMHALRQIAHELHCAIVAIHHTRKEDSRKYRGTNAIEGAVDNIILVQSRKEEMLVTVSCERAKNSPRFEKFAALANITDECFTLDAAAVPVRKGRLGKAREVVIKYLVSEGSGTVKQIVSAATATGYAANAVRDACYKLKDLGVLYHPDNHPAGVYTLAEGWEMLL